MAGKKGDKDKKSASSPKTLQKKSALYEISGDTVTRKRKSCPKCGEGVFLAEHKDRKSCGRCGYTEFKKKEKQEA